MIQVFDENGNLKTIQTNTGSSIAIGDTVTGGTPKYYLYVDASGNLADSGSLTQESDGIALAVGAIFRSINSGQTQIGFGAAGDELDITTDGGLGVESGIALTPTTAIIYSLNGEISMNASYTYVHNDTKLWFDAPIYNFGRLTASTVPIIDASKNLISSAYAITDFGLIANPLSQFASTTSAQLAGVISDETGSGALVFGTNPILKYPVIADSTDATKTLQFSLSGATTGKSTTLSFSQTDNHTISFPNWSGNLSTNITLTMPGGNQSTTSATVVSLTDLVTAVEANATYWVDATFRVGCNNTGGVKFELDLPTGATFSGNLWGISSSFSAYTGSNFLNGSLFGPVVTVNGVGFAKIWGFITMSSTAGNAQFGFASNTAGQTSTVYSSSTMIKLTRIS